MDEPAPDRRAALAALERRATFRISRTSKLMDRLTARLAAAEGLSLLDYRILMVTGLFGSITAADLGRLMVVDRAQVSRTVASLVAQGLLVARPDPASRRQRLLRLTERAETMMAEVRPRLEGRQADLFADLPVEDMEALMRILDRLSHVLADELEEPAAVESDAVRG